MKRGSILTVMAAAFLWFARGYCDNHHVSPDGSDEWPYLTPETASKTIQGAVDAARPGGIVCIARGDYYEHVVMGEGLTLLGSGRDQTRIWGSIRAGGDAEIRRLAVRQDRLQHDPAFAKTAVVGRPTGGFIVADCFISGTFRTGIDCSSRGGFIVVQRCEVRGIRATDGSAIDMHGLQPMFCVVDECTIADNFSGLSTGGTVDLWLSRSTLTGNLHWAVFLFGPAFVYACSIDRNEEGVAANGYEQRVRIESSTLCQNAEYGLWYGEFGVVELVCSTVTDNGTAGVAAFESTSIAARGSIIWGNGSADVSFLGPRNSFSAWGSDIGGRGYSAEPSLIENIEADPLFVDPDRGNYRLRPESPCIDGWRKGAGPGLQSSFDRDGRHRWVYGGGPGLAGVDMGAYEYHINLISPGPAPAEVTLTWSSLGLRTYSVYYTDDFLTWHLAQADLPSAGPRTTSWIDDGSLTGLPPSLVPRRFYRVLENP